MMWNEWVEETKVFFYRKLDRIVGFWERLCMACAYFKLGFNSCDFDSNKAIEEFAWKLGRIRRHLSKHNIVLGIEDECAKIKEVEEKLDRVLKDEYYEKIYEPPITERFGERDYSFDPVEGSSHYTLLSRRSKQSDADEEEIRKLEFEALKASHKALMKDWKDALKIIEKHIFKWWD